MLLTDSLLIPWSRVFLEKLTGSQLVKKFPAFYGTRRCITLCQLCCLHLVVSSKQDRQCTYNVTLRRVRATTVAMEKQ